MTPSGKARLALDEGLRLIAYQDKGGVWTNGRGHTGPDVFAGQTISQAQADAWFEADIAREETILRRLPWFLGLDPVRQDVLINIAFNVGAGELLHWPMTLGHFAAHDWPAAAHDLLTEGKWDRDVGPRAVRLARVTAAGAWSAA